MQKTTQACALTLAIASFTVSITQVRAQPAQLVSNSQNAQGRSIQRKPGKAPAKPQPRAPQVRFILPKLPDTGAPGGRQGAGSRGSSTPLTALVPEVKQTLGKGPGENLAVTHVWGLTVAEYPTFWFYVPDLGTSIGSIEFVLQDQAGNEVYQTPVTLPERPGVVSLRLPSTTAPLEVGKMYHWYFKIYDNPQNPSDPIAPVFVEGWVQRVILSPTFESQLAAATPQQRSALYAANGIWYDTLTSLAELRLTNPGDAALTADWTDLLQSVGLNEIAAKPIVQCCAPENFHAAGSSREQRYFQVTP